MNSQKITLIIIHNRSHSLSFIGFMIFILMGVLSGCDGEGSIYSDSAFKADQGVYVTSELDMYTTQPPTGGMTMVLEERAPYGAPCESEDDCQERACVVAGANKICTRSCASTCDAFPDGQAAFCRYDPAQNSNDFLCYPSQNRLCQACLDESQCDGSPCIETNEGMRCTQFCRTEDDCPSEFSCQQGTCYPVNGSCDCGTSNAGETRICEQSNGFGRCLGEESCDPMQGWVGCTAETPSEEICDGIDQNCNGIIDENIPSLTCQVTNEFGSCNGVLVCQGASGSECYGAEASAELCDLIDNDCDGAIDEDFTLPDGRYGLDTHCGRCGTVCEGQVPNASATRCDSDREIPICVAESCVDGFQVVDGVACVPTEDVICQPCIDASSCSARSPGAACVEVGDPQLPETLIKVCGRDCSLTGTFGTTCPEGYNCQQLLEGGIPIYQCLPMAGHCLCLNQPEGFSIPCQVDSPLNPALSCQGRRSCEDGNFGACILPQEVCDGVDNDCDGIIDNGFRTEDGEYRLDPEHCGRCQLSCSQLSFPNAEAVCHQEAQIPHCQMICSAGFVDLENGSDDGCECEIIPGIDQPDGIDQNCDGVDGDRSVALFVSKTGNDEGLGTLDDPLFSITRALELASGPQATIRDIYVATGVYSENISLIEGVSLYGGYSLDFRDRDPSEHPTTLFGRPISNEAKGTLTAIHINTATYVDGFSIYGANATNAGGNSVAVYLINSNSELSLSNNIIIAGNGAPGQRGEAGTSGAIGIDGQRGQDALTASSSSCNNQETVGGSGGIRSCGGVNVRGGTGGTGHCPITQWDSGVMNCAHQSYDSCRNTCYLPDDNCQPLPPPQGTGESGFGSASASATGGGATYDRWSDLGVCDICTLYPKLPHLGNPGNDGANGAQGASGQGCSDGSGSLNAQFIWSTYKGQNGGAGLHGTGGGGGSAGSGFDVTPNVLGSGCFDTIGGSGGGGGSGGCGGQSGQGGTGGGGSFAILMAYGAQGAPEGLPQLINNRIIRGIGGQGGAGGTGGIGGFGGEGANGGIASGVFCAEPGGRGGNGGDGGHGGGGGGGCGGISVSIYLSGAPLDQNGTIYSNSNEIIDSGRAGLGGQGGGSTGLPGSAGLSGLLSNIIAVE